jgi:hypothetical protein
MSYEEEFDRIIRKKAEEVDYSFDEGNWEKAARMLDSERGKTPPARVVRNYWTSVVLSAAGVAGIVALLGIYMDDQPSPETKQLAVQAQHPGHQNITASRPADLPAPQSAEQQSLQSPLEANDNATDMPALEPAKTNVSPVKSRIPAVVTPQSKETGSTPATNDQETKNSVSSEPALTATPIKSTPSLFPSSQEDNETKENVPPAPTIDPPTIAVSDEVNEAVSVEAVFADQLAMRHSFIDPQTNELEIMNSVNLLTYYDDYYTKIRNRHTFAVEAGAIYLPGWNTNTGMDAKGFNGFAGLVYEYLVTSSFGIGSGIQAFGVRNIEQPFFAQESIDYHFGSSQTGTMITTNEVMYVAVPLNILFSFNKNNRMSLGVNAGRIVCARNTVETYTVLDNVRTMAAPEKNTGIYDGINPYNLMLTAGYLTGLSKRFSVRAELNYGLSDIFLNNKTVGNNERLVGIRVALRYNILQR